MNVCRHRESGTPGPLADTCRPHVSGTSEHPVNTTTLHVSGTSEHPVNTTTSHVSGTPEHPVNTTASTCLARLNAPWHAGTPREHDRFHVSGTPERSLERPDVQPPKLSGQPRARSSASITIPRVITSPSGMGSPSAGITR